MPDALSQMLIEFRDDRKIIDEVQQRQNDTAACYERAYRSMSRHAIAFVLAMIALSCCYLAWDRYEQKVLLKHVQEIKQMQLEIGKPSSFDRFYRDYQRAGGAAAFGRKPQ